MIKSVVLKYFLFTSLLFSMMFLLIGISLNYFFEKYYIEKKLDTLKIYANEYLDMAMEKGTETASKEIYENNYIWITKLDEYGIIYDVENYYIDVELSDGSGIMKIAMYPFESAFSSDPLSLLKVGDNVVIDTINIADSKIPYQVQTDSFGVINLEIANKLHGSNSDEAYTHLETGLSKGTITKIVYEQDIPFPYKEDFFLKQIKEFGTKLLVNKLKASSPIQEFSITENFAEYKIIIKPFIENGNKVYIFAMISLQPVDEAMLVIQQFYPYFFGFSFLCVMILALVFSRSLAKPLTAIKRITGKIANMDFTEKLPVKSADEIGQLSQNINYLSSQMESYIEQLKQELDKERKLETVRKEFIAGVSHELKTPLAVMKSCLSIIKDEIASEKREHYFNAMENEIEKTNLLITNMLELAKFESGTYKPEMQAFEIDRVIKEVCASLSKQIQDKNISLVLRLSPQTLVLGHKGLISRVVSNFLSNAIRHTDNGKSILIVIKNSENKVEISVENQGKNISADNMKKIWNQFYRAEVKNSKSGTGLGLSISKEILELHHASYGVKNIEDGVTFFFTLNREI